MLKEKENISPFFLGSLSGLWMIAVENPCFLVTAPS